MGVMRWTVLVFLGCLGCATLPPPPVLVTEFVDEAVRVYDLRDLRGVQLTARGPWVASAGRDQIFLHRAWAMTAMTEVIVAHEVAHFVLGHDRESRVRPASQIQDEMDANAKAVEILVRVRHRSERAAVAAVKDLLTLAAQQRWPTGPGHAGPCVELADLARRFPQYEVRSTVCP